jgi:hypothetical protein
MQYGDDFFERPLFYLARFSEEYNGGLDFLNNYFHADCHDG